MTVRLIVFTLAALSLVNAYSFVKLYSSTYVSNDMTISGLSLARSPASIPPEQFVIPVKNLNARISYDLNCGTGKKMTGHYASGHWVQLKGRMCSGDKLKLVEITNLNNGFTASVLNVGAKQYQTDLIQLDQGDNKIRIRITPVKGDAEEQTVVVVGQAI